MNAQTRKLARRVALASVTLTFLAGCSFGSDAAETTNNKRVYEDHIKLEDGRTVTCLVYAAGHKGGLDCDWVNAK